jgi:hypothetical protein
MEVVAGRYFWLSWRNPASTVVRLTTHHIADAFGVWREASVRCDLEDMTAFG